MFNVHGKWASRLVNTVGISRKHEMSRAVICVFTVCCVCVYTGHCPSLGRRGRGDYRAMERGYDVPPLLSG